MRPIKIFLTILFLVFSNFSLASYTCLGPVGGVSIDNTGTVWAETIANLPWLQICNVVVRQNNFDPATCKSIHAQLLTAQTTSRPVTLYFNDARNCANHPAWEFVTNGLYFLTLQ